MLSETIQEASSDPKAVVDEINQKINLNYRTIRFIDKVPDRFRHIKILFLNHNCLDSLSGIEQFSQLEELHVKFNYISNFEDIYKISNRFALKILNVKGNPIEKHAKCNFDYLQSLFFNLTELNDRPYYRAASSSTAAKNQLKTQHQNVTQTQKEKPIAITARQSRPQSISFRLNISKTSKKDFANCSNNNNDEQQCQNQNKDLSTTTTYRGNSQSKITYDQEIQCNMNIQSNYDSKKSKINQLQSTQQQQYQLAQYQNIETQRGTKYQANQQQQQQQLSTQSKFTKSPLQELSNIVNYDKSLTSRSTRSVTHNPQNPLYPQYDVMDKENQQNLNNLGTQYQINDYCDNNPYHNNTASKNFYLKEPQSNRYNQTARDHSFSIQQNYSQQQIQQQLNYNQQEQLFENQNNFDKNSKLISPNFQQEYLENSNSNICNYQTNQNQSIKVSPIFNQECVNNNNACNNYKSCQNQTVKVSPNFQEQEQINNNNIINFQSQSMNLPPNFQEESDNNNNNYNYKSGQNQSIKVSPNFQESENNINNFNYKNSQNQSIISPNFQQQQQQQQPPFFQTTKLFSLDEEALFANQTQVFAQNMLPINNQVTATFAKQQKLINNNGNSSKPFGFADFHAQQRVSNNNYHVDTLSNNNPLDTQIYTDISFENIPQRNQKLRKELTSLNLSRISQINQKSLTNISIPQLRLDTVLDGANNMSNINILDGVEDNDQVNYVDMNNTVMIHNRIDQHIENIDQDILKLAILFHQKQLKEKVIASFKQILNQKKQQTIVQTQPNNDLLQHQQQQQSQQLQQEIINNNNNNNSKEYLLDEDIELLKYRQNQQLHQQQQQQPQKGDQNQANQIQQQHQQQLQQLEISIQECQEQDHFFQNCQNNESNEQQQQQQQQLLAQHQQEQMQQQPQAFQQQQNYNSSCSEIQMERPTLEDDFVDESHDDAIKMDTAKEYCNNFMKIRVFYSWRTFTQNRKTSQQMLYNLSNMKKGLLALSSARDTARSTTTNRKDEPSSISAFDDMKSARSTSVTTARGGSFQQINCDELPLKQGDAKKRNNKNLNLPLSSDIFCINAGGNNNDNKKN